MIPLSVTQIAEATGARLADVADPDALVQGPVVIDSREVVPGSLFAALPEPGPTVTRSPPRRSPPEPSPYWPPGQLAGRR